jgi:hypothetical protein
MSGAVSLRDQLASIIDSLPKGMTCQDCARCYIRYDNDQHGFCSALPPASFMLDGKITTRDPLASFDRPACILFQGQPA